MLDETGVVHTMSVHRLLALCVGSDPSQIGIFESDGQILIGDIPKGATIFLSMTEVLIFIETRGVGNIPKEDLLLVFWTKTINPITLGWYIFTQEEVAAMQEEELGTTSATGHYH